MTPASVTLAVRRCALQSLYQLDAAADGGGPLVGTFHDDADGAAAPDAVERGIELARLAWEHRHDADRELGALARDWPPHRQPLVDRNVLRLGWYELRRTAEPPRKVVSDAVELAKEFGTAESGKFVNGVLDRVMNPAAAAAPEGG